MQRWDLAGFHGLKFGWPEAENKSLLVSVRVLVLGIHKNLDRWRDILRHLLFDQNYDDRTISNKIHIFLMSKGGVLVPLDSVKLELQVPIL